MDTSTPQPSSNTWPGAFGIFKPSRAASLVNWQTYLVLMVISVVISIVISMIAGGDETTPQYYIGQILSWVFSIFLTVSATIVELKNASHEKTNLGDAVSDSTQHFVSMLISSMVVGLLALGSLLLFVVPFFFVLPRIALYTYYVVDKKLGPIDAVKASWNNTKGHAGKVWGIMGANLLFALLVFTIIGIPVAAYLLFMYASSSALLYRWIEGKQPTSPASPTAPNPSASPLV